MKEVVSQMSGMATANSTMLGLLSQPIWFGSVRIPALASSVPMMPKLSISRNRQSRPATTGAIING